MCCKQQLAVVRLWCWHCRGLGLTGLVSIETTSCGNYFAPFICCGFSMSYEESDCCNWSRRLWCCTCATVCSTASYHVIWSGYHPALIDNLLQDNSLFVTRAATVFFGQFHAAGSSKSSLAMHTEFCALGASVLWHEWSFCTARASLCTVSAFGFGCMGSQSWNPCGSKKESRDHLGSRKNTGTPGATKSTGTAI